MDGYSYPIDIIIGGWIKNIPYILVSDDSLFKIQRRYLSKSDTINITDKCASVKNLFLVTTKMNYREEFDDNGIGIIEIKNSMEYFIQYYGKYVNGKLRFFIVPGLKMLNDMTISPKVLSSIIYPIDRVLIDPLAKKLSLYNGKNLVLTHWYVLVCQNPI